MKITLLLFLLSCLAGIGVWAQQSPPKTTAPASRTLTPAEQRQKEKIEREVQRERQIRAEWLQKQREYEAKQAEKERQKQARKAEKDNQQQVREAAKTAPAPAPATPTVPSVSQPAPSVVTSPEPSRAERNQKRRKESVAEPAPATEPADQNKSMLPAPVAEPPPVTTEPSRAERREQRRKETRNRPAPKPAEPVVVPEAPVEAPRQPKTVRPRRLPRPTATVVDSAATATSEPAVIRPRKEFLPKGHLFEPILLDPLESQAYGSVLPAYYTEGEKYKGSIVPFAFGFAKPFYRRTTDPGRSEEWVLDVASFTQFEVYYDYIKDKQRRQIMNTDYKVSILYNVRRGVNNYRFRVYHLSSHLGDDYLFRNRITAPSPNSVNYEVIDATYSRVVDTWRLYGGIGIGLRRSEERKRFSAQLGAFYKKPSTHLARLVGGVDIKFWQQTDFRPGIHAGIGVEVGRSQNNLTFLAEGYSGFRPYSQFEQQQTVWLGIGMYLNPF